MQILLANAKIMFDKADRKPISVPLFQSVANVLAEEMARMNVKELARQLDCSSKIATENWKRYRLSIFHDQEPCASWNSRQAVRQ